MAALRAEGVPVYSHLRQPLHRLPRLAVDTPAPRVMWTENLRRHGVDYRGLELRAPGPASPRRSRLGWNYIADDPAAMTSLADAFVKAEERLGDLRAYERRRPPEPAGWQPPSR